MIENILEVKNLNIVLGNEKIIDNLNFNLKEGENLGIIGPNGAGKTILLKALLGIILPLNRNAFIEGEITWKKGLKISYVPQNILPEKDLPLNVKEFFKINELVAKTSPMRSHYNSTNLVERWLWSQKKRVIKTEDYL